MTYQETINRVSYEGQIREMDADELITAYYEIITKGNIPKHRHYLDLIRKQYKQITGIDIRDIISKTA